MKKLRELRKEKDLTIRDLQNIFGIGKSTLSLYENGKRDADHETLKKIADYFNVSIDYLLGRTECKRKFSQDEYYNIIRIADKLGLTIDQLLGGQIDNPTVTNQIHTLQDKVREKAQKQGVDADMILSDEQIDMFIAIAQKLKAKKNNPHG
jgi:transcriptional regulator with XRE-family HTH domain